MTFIGFPGQAFILFVYNPPNCFSCCHKSYAILCG